MGLFFVDDKNKSKVKTKLPPQPTKTIVMPTPAYVPQNPTDIMQAVNYGQTTVSSDTGFVQTLEQALTSSNLTLHKDINEAVKRLADIPGMNDSTRFQVAARTLNVNKASLPSMLEAYRTVLQGEANKFSQAIETTKQSQASVDVSDIEQKISAQKEEIARLASELQSMETDLASKKQALTNFYSSCDFKQKQFNASYQEVLKNIETIFNKLQQI